MMYSTRIFAVLATLGLAAQLYAGIICSQPPKPGGGTLRWSQLWQDPSGQGNDLDGDSIIYADFVVNSPVSIDHAEWWGTGACEIGFQVEFWKQDPGTIAYQPYGVFRGSGAKPEKKYSVLLPTITSDPSGMLRYSVDLPTPTNLAANSTANPRWFFTVIGLTSHAYYTWNWAQNSMGSTRCFQYVRGGHEGGGDLYRVLPEGRAMLLSQNAWISGTLDFGAGFLGTYAAPGFVTFELRNGGTPVETHTVDVPESGLFTFPTSLSGTYDIAITGSHWLRKVIAGITIGSGGASGVNATLINGDVDADNVVSVFDYIVLSDAFDSLPGDWNWWDAADLDHDGVVSVFDYIILSDNFDHQGDE